MQEEYLKLIGDIPKDKDKYTRRHRLHQGWWRTSVLVETQGPHPNDSSKSVCNTFHINPQTKSKNFLRSEAYQAVQEEIKKRKYEKGSGMIQEPRIWNNLLSSQPLCFNFWGPIKQNVELANKFLPYIIPGYRELIDIRFEWAPQPKEEYTDDNSAFDVAITYHNTEGEIEILGLECKYTDSFSETEYDKPAYRKIFNACGDIFKEKYEFYINSKFNQLFRNQLIAQAYQSKHHNRVICGLFCGKTDDNAIVTANGFQSALISGNEQFCIITFEKFIEALQRSEIDWDIREWSMMLWARYLGLSLSENAFKESAYEKFGSQNIN